MLHFFPSDKGRKRKQDDLSSFPDDQEGQLSKKRKSSVVKCMCAWFWEGMIFPLEYSSMFSSLKQKVSYKEKEEDEDDDDDDEYDVKEPSWEKQEAMVRRLQKKFPDQDKEVRHTNAECVTHQDT